MGLAEHLDRLYWKDVVLRIDRGFEKARDLLEKATDQKQREIRRDIGKRRVMNSIHVGMQAYVVERELPRDVTLLAELVRDDRFPLDRRAKVLEVMILRGAINEFPYQTIVDMNMQGAFGDRLQYQAAAKEAVLKGPPELFGQLSRSRDQLPDDRSGRYPATEWMNTMMRQGGLVGSYEARQKELEPWLLNLPAEQRGQAMFHLRDAMEAREIGAVAKISGFEVSGGPVGFGLSWDNAKDTHWDRVGNDVLGPVAAGLESHPEQNKAFYDGYRLADRELPDPRK